jgi:hypothetical protein
MCDSYSKQTFSTAKKTEVVRRKCHNMAYYAINNIKPLIKMLADPYKTS